MTIEDGWIAFDLGRFRRHEAEFATYSGSSPTALPTLPVAHPGGLHAWMRELVPLGDLAAGPYGLVTLTDGAPVGEHEAALPEQFVAFMADPVLRDNVPTCTSCYWEPELPVAASPVHEGAQLVRFLNDQQGCLFWYLHLLPGGGHEVLCGGHAYDEYEVPRDEALEDLVRVAGDFDGFIARFWIENLAWFEVVGQKRPDESLSGPVWEYVRQYASAVR
ncbi:hypothetical protein CS0771_60360 [Catellatospora sp. IY07-71]|uniref:hypothetical protein n=1 Tax=Catellatospora sp. IY07-71 TaxID=2728827 RepID=UPI001BB3B723|nr:hypothetical protein [Catellatospora sp. IY07-71]BCJ76492.1 hypothetical protein CS0771_60360 [Catellatospora sp. IY07-71]